MSDELELDRDLGGVMKVEWSSAMTPKDIILKRREGWILLSFCWSRIQMRFIYYFVKADYFP